MGRTTTTKRFTLLLWLVVFALASTAQAQTTVATRISTTPNGIFLVIDGQTYPTPITLLWPQGSSHTIHANSQVALDTSNLYAFQSWKTNAGPLVSTTSDSTTVVVTADSAITEIDAVYQSAFLVRIAYFDCPGHSDPVNPCPSNLSPGTLVINGQTFTMSGSLYTSGTVTLQATPNPGWVFNGWNTGTGTSNQGFVNSITVTAAVTIAPIFVPGRTMTIQSSPSQLQVLADRTPVETPANLTWGISSTHQLGSSPDQLDLQGKLWVFSSWSDGGPINHAYQVPNVTGPAITLTANYLPGQRVSFLTNPPGLTLAIDGRSNWLSNNFNWAVNSQHTVSAPQTQTDASGNIYTFSSWSQGGAASQVVTATQDPNGLNLQFTANYTATGPSRISVVSQTSGVVIQVDGQDCALPCSVSRPGGTSVRLTAPATIALGGDSRLSFLGWSDSPAADRQLVATSGPLTLTLNYSLQNRLMASVAPVEGASVVTTPAAADGFFDAQSQVQVAAQTKLGFKFASWEGDATGSSPTISLTMSTPHVVRAILTRVPTLYDGAVQNSAGATPAVAVSPGSIVSIYGVNLTSALQVGPSSPLAQTLSNLTVQMNGELAPLLFVSPGQINAQVPPDLADGTYTMVLHSDGNPDISQSFTVARNAPGLFNTVVDGNAYGLFVHQDGSPITSSSPAHRDETVTLLGTGFGPLMQTPIEGFPVAESANSVLADPLTITLGDGTVVTSTYTGAADGKVGLDEIRFTIADPLPTATTVSLKVSVGGQDSNTVLLPLE
jgi:uncharacterized protein (TIGR03437 family)